MQAVLRQGDLDSRPVKKNVIFAFVHERSHISVSKIKEQQADPSMPAAMKAGRQEASNETSQKQ